MIIKVCGMKHAGNIRELDKLKPDMTGFIFHSSSPRFADSVPEYMPASSLRVGVFVNSETDYILYKVSEFGLNLVQLHGNESPEQCRAIRSKGIDIIKAFQLNADNADTITAPYEGLCRYYLFDLSRKYTIPAQRRDKAGKPGTDFIFLPSVVCRNRHQQRFRDSSGTERHRSHRQIHKTIKDTIKTDTTMDRINQLFSNKKHDILSIYFCAGAPKADNTAEVITSLETRLKPTIQQK